MQAITRPLLALALSVALGAPALAAAVFPGSDPSVRPQDDFFRHVNGQWLETAQIPGDKKAYGTFMLLREKSDADVRALLEGAAARPTGEDRMIGEYYAALLDLPAIEKAGIQPLKEDLARIDRIKNLNDLADLLGHLQASNVSIPVVAFVSPDQKAPGTNVVYWTQAGLGLPDRDYYLRTGAESEALQKAYRDYLATLLALAGEKKAAAAAAEVYGFERKLAEIAWARVDRRDALKTYNPVPRSEWAQRYPGFPWARFAQGVKMPAEMGAIVREPGYFYGFARLAGQTPIATWKAYLKAHLLDSYAEYMGPKVRQAHHRFHGEKLQGLKAMPPAWRTAVTATNDALGEAIGERYVAKHFPPAAKARMRTLVDNLLAVYQEGLEKLEWMTPATRKQALDKLARFTVKIGYPDRWRGHAGLVVKKGDAIGNVMRASRFHAARDMADAGKPVDRSRWYMTPQTVNAYYDPTANEIVFPAAILQPPFFDMNGDDAYNYGAIGAVIGHEISHGFDDQGRRYDGEGKLRDWWTPEDEKAFTARAERLVAQYDGFEALPGEHVNGKLTLGENIADLAGVAMAYRAYHRALGAQAAPTVDGLTAKQRFFYGYARVWRSKSRPEWLRMRLVSDPHSPEQFRTNGVVSNLDIFYDAFELKAGDALYKRPEDRVRIW